MSLNFSESQNEWLEVGKLKSIYRYPVKGMAGEVIQEVKINDESGVDGDRHFVFIQDALLNSNANRFPWLTDRQLPELVLYKAIYDDSLNIRESTVSVTTLSGNTFSVTDPLLKQELEERFGKSLVLERSKLGNPDSARISMISTNSVADLSREVGEELDIRRFRQNLIIDITNEMNEQDWINGLVRIGDDVVIAITRGDPRCMVITIDPDTAKLNLEIHRIVVNKYYNLMGVYASVVKMGVVKTGDNIYFKFI